MTAYDLAQRFVGEIHELPGAAQAPFIQWCFECCGYGPDTPDEVPWCGVFASRIAWLLRLPRSKSAAARSWLTVGLPVEPPDAEVGFDVVVLKRGGIQPGVDVLDAPGHVGFFAGFSANNDTIYVLGGNQSNGVTVAPYPLNKVLGIRRLGPPV